MGYAYVYDCALKTYIRNSKNLIMGSPLDISSSERISLSDIFLSYNLDKDVRIIDVACGVGIVAEEIGKVGYRNIDGLDPSRGYIKVVEARGIYKVIHYA